MKRVVVELEGNLTFCGIDKGEIEIEGKVGLLVETDKKSGLKIWCPKEMIKDILVIPISEV
ncbi:hypothetical protein RBU61_04675 [Tissierella sp. MB52-C2]|uniref:hypothetical protein n=1 Tax=Tissierella sp. MB52-C2 TaxID=3070999 RepID=UPI00280C1485|nr:hypothetical protein [Tissierella sp. MB52-C2]WMM25971.1 hypothetical protein RBU61_04675 [Tissierella sp. MB52-C2]